MKSEKYKRVDIFFSAFALSLIPMGLFLLLSDVFIGKTTEGWYGVVALLNDSQRTNFGRVVPLGIFVSILGFITYGTIFLCKKFVQKEKIRGYLGFSLLFFGFTMLFLLQHYPRHGVIGFLGFTWDIKNYVACAIALYFLIQFMHAPKKR